IVLQAEGPFQTGPVDCRGRALTIKAREGVRPKIELLGAGQPWQPLFCADRPLQLQGLELSCARSGSSFRTGGVVHLVYSKGAPVTLIGCRLLASGYSAPLVCREAIRLEVRDCTVVAHSAALCVESGERSVDMNVVGSTLQVEEKRGAALAVWE